jgi:D-lactate dehydrogenase
MNLYFIDPEPSEQSFLKAALNEHVLHFFGADDTLPAEAIVLSIFTNRHIDAAFLDAHPALRFIATRSSTHDHIDLAECARRQVAVSYVPTYGNHTVAEHAFALMLALARRLREAIAFDREKFSYEALRGFQLRGKTLGVIGTGRVGMRVLHLARGFGMKRIACDIAPRSTLARRLGFQYVPFEELLRRADIITLHAALTPETYHLFDEDAFAKCRPGVFIINTARGALIDTDALCSAVDSGVVGGAGLDVLEDERVLRGACTRIVSDQIVTRLRTLFQPAEPRLQNPQRLKEIARLLHNEQLLARPNVVFTPHIAFNSAEAIERINRTTAENIKAYLRGKPINLLTPRRPREVAPSESSPVRSGAKSSPVLLSV